MGLVTCCPKCDSEYEVTVDQLKLHDGLVRCGQCHHVFDGFACLKDALPTLTRKAANQTAQAPVVPASTSSTPAPSKPLNIPVEQDGAAATNNKLATEPAPITQPGTQTDPSAQSATPVNAGKASLVTERPAGPNESTGATGATTGLATTASQASDTDSDAPSSKLVLAQDGPFVPSVDRRNEGLPTADGRREPNVRFTRVKATDDKSVEPNLGDFGAVELRADDREPSLGEFTSGAVFSARSEPKPAAAVRVFGESRVKGDDPSAFGRTMPEFLEDEEEVSQGASVLWILGSIVLAVVLIVQSLVVFRNDIVASVPSLRPLLAQLCQPLSCEVSYVRQIDRIFIVGSSLQQSTDTQPGGNQRAYVLRLTLQNRAAYPQPWPALMLTLTDASGTAVIKKAMLPSEFLPPNLLEGPMAARQEVGLDIPLTVEGLNISGYELERFFP